MAGLSNKAGIVASRSYTEHHKKKDFKTEFISFLDKHFIEYDEPRIFRLPGNYQNWNVPLAPKIISRSGNGEYEGFINFTNTDSKFYLVNGTQWDNVTTYNQTGPGKFGFNGTFFAVPGAPGIYKVNASTNNYTWTFTKIYSWGLKGTAVAPAANTDAVMAFDEPSLSWRITTDLSKGNFLFRANKSDAINFGHNSNSGMGIPDYDGEKIPIAKPGNYTIVLYLLSAGNYMYGIQKNS